jgi:hypothetical protein
MTRVQAARTTKAKERVQTNLTNLRNPNRPMGVRMIVIMAISHKRNRA